MKDMSWAFVNPLVQAQTLILLMEAQIMSPQQVQDELPDGVAIEDLYAMIADAKAEAENMDTNQDTKSEKPKMKDMICVKEETQYDEHGNISGLRLTLDNGEVHRIGNWKD